jgi:hypothetical protein
LKVFVNCAEFELIREVMFLLWLILTPDGLLGGNGYELGSFFFMETGLVLSESGTKQIITKFKLTIHTFCVLDDTQCAPHTCVSRNGALTPSLSKLL